MLVDDADVTGLAVRKRSVAMVYQQFINYPSFTVYENIASPLRLAGLAAAEIDARRSQTRRAMLHIDAPARPRCPPSSPAASSSAAPSPGRWSRMRGLLLLDEPLVNLDYKLREELRAELPALFAGAARSSSTPRPSPPRR